MRWKLYILVALDILVLNIYINLRFGHCSIFVFAPKVGRLCACVLHRKCFGTFQVLIEMQNRLHQSREDINAVQNVGLNYD